MLNTIKEFFRAESKVGPHWPRPQQPPHASVTPPSNSFGSRRTGVSYPSSFWSRSCFSGHRHRVGDEPPLLVSVPSGKLPAFVYWVRVDKEKRGKSGGKQGFFPLNKETGGHGEEGAAESSAPP